MLKNTYAHDSKVQSRGLSLPDKFSDFLIEEFEAKERNQARLLYEHSSYEFIKILYKKIITPGTLHGCSRFQMFK